MLRWIGYKEPIDLSADAIASDAVDGSMAWTLAGVSRKNEEHSATLARLDALIGEVIEMQRRFDARMLVVESRVGNDWGQALERRLASDFNALMDDAFEFERLRSVRCVANKADIRYRDVVHHEDAIDLAQDERRISKVEITDLLNADMLGFGVRLAKPHRMWLVGEASSVIDGNDIARARRWADILQKIYPDDAARGFAYGISLADGCEALAQEAGVSLFLVEERA